MIKKLAIGLVMALLVVGIALWQAPARLATNALANSGEQEIRLLSPRGTLWNGSGQLLVNGEPIGELNWQVQFGRLFALEAATAWQLNNTSYALQGVVALDSDNRIQLRGLNGRVRESLLRAALSPYDIMPAGDLTLERLDITDLRLNAKGNWPRQISAEGRARWTGGPVNYRLAGEDFAITLPAMQAQITTPTDAWPILEVTEQESGALLMTGRLTPNGGAAIGITRGFTRLTGQPWPGSEPDHAVVLEVEEQLI